MGACDGARGTGPAARRPGAGGARLPGRGRAAAGAGRGPGRAGRRPGLHHGHDHAVPAARQGRRHPSARRPRVRLRAARRPGCGAGVDDGAPDAQAPGGRRRPGSRCCPGSWPTSARRTSACWPACWPRTTASLARRHDAAGPGARGRERDAGAGQRRAVPPPRAGPGRPAADAARAGHVPGHRPGALRGRVRRPGAAAVPGRAGRLVRGGAGARQPGARLGCRSRRHRRRAAGRRPGGHRPGGAEPGSGRAGLPPARRAGPAGHHPR